MRDKRKGKKDQTLYIKSKRLWLFVTSVYLNDTNTGFKIYIHEEEEVPKDEKKKSTKVDSIGKERSYSRHFKNVVVGLLYRGIDLTVSLINHSIKLVRN